MTPQKPELNAAREAESSPAMAAVMDAVALLQAGALVEGRTRLLALWESSGPRAAPMQRSTIAHFLADTEEDPSRELEWDLAALDAAIDRDAGETISPDVAAFLPSLHLNVGDAYRRSGNPGKAIRHAILGIECCAGLPESSYGDMIRSGLERLRARLSRFQAGGQCR